MGSAMTMFRSPPSRQRGVALVIGLIFLALVSLIATVGMRQSITQERMAGGLRNESLARAGAETAVRAAERELFDDYLTSNDAVRDADPTGGTDGIYTANAETVEEFREAPPDEFFTTGATALDTAIVDLEAPGEDTAALAEQPVFISEQLGRVRPAGTGTGMEGGSTGTENYQGTGGGSPAGNSDMYVYRLTGRATGGIDTIVRTVETTYLVRSK
jgi:type IV pilus assembly protein PilX